MPFNDGVGRMIHLLARGGSRGLPRKHLLDLGGRPVIAHAAATLAAKGDAWINTDEQEIADAARAAGARFECLVPVHGETTHPDLPFEWLSERLGQTGPALMALGNYPLVSGDDVARIFGLLDRYERVFTFHRLPPLRLARLAGGVPSLIPLPAPVYYQSWPRGVRGQKGGGDAHLLLDDPHGLDIDEAADLERCKAALGLAHEPDRAPTIERGGLRLRMSRWFPEWCWVLDEPLGGGVFRRARALVPDAPQRRQELTIAWEITEDVP